MQTNFFIHKKGLCDRARICQTRGFNNDAVKLQLTRVSSLRQGIQCDDQIPPNRTTNTAIIHFDNLLIAVLHQNFIVDVFLTKLIFNDSNLKTMLFLQNAV